jgi:Sugar (and other) transporter
MSSALIGCRQGAIASGVLSDKSGRKRLLMGANQLTIVIGVLSAQLMNWLIARPVPAGITGLEILNSRNGQMGWRWMFGGTAVPAPLFLLAVLAVPESPHWLAKNGQFDRARAILGRLGGPALASLETENNPTDFGEGCGARRFPRTARTEDGSHPRARHLPRRFPAIVRNQCGVQLCSGGFRGRRLSGVRYPVQHSRDWRGDVCLHLHRYSDSRPSRSAAIDAGGGGGIGRHLSAAGTELLSKTRRLASAGADVGRGCLLLVLACADHLGNSLRDFPNRIRGAAMAVSVFPFGPDASY